MKKAAFTKSQIVMTMIDYGYKFAYMALNDSKECYLIKPDGKGWALNNNSARAVKRWLNTQTQRQLMKSYTKGAIAGKKGLIIEFEVVGNA